MKKSLFCIVIFCTLLGAAYGRRSLAADQKAEVYRTGEIDPRIAQIPPELNMGVFVKPDTYLPRLVTFLTADTGDEFLKVKRIHDWITDNIAYDSDLFYGTGDEGSRKTYNLLPLKRTTCGGFSRLFKEMADLAGLEAVYISGYAKSYYILSSNRQGNHAWNGVKIKGKWYLVDSTADNRMGYKKGIYGDKGPYQDHDLFIHPDAKILVNLPYDSQYQFQEKKIDLEQFLNSPRVYKNFYTYAVQFETDMQSLVSVGREEREGGNQVTLFDKIDLTAESTRIKLTAPEDVIIRARLNDEEGTAYTYNAYASRENGKTVCFFSPPRAGTFTARIQARFYGSSGGFKTVYKVRINGKTKGRFMPPVEKKLFTNGLLTLQGVQITESELNGKKGYYMLDLKIPDGFSAYAELRDVDDKKVKNVSETSYPGADRKRCFFKMPGKGTYFLLVYSKRQEQKYHQRSALVRIESSGKSNTLLPPEGELFYTKQFIKTPVVLLNENVLDPGGAGGPGKKSVYQLELKKIRGYTMSCSLKGTDDKKYKEHAAYHTDVNTYTFYFTAPGPGEYKARIFVIDPEGKYNTVLYFSIKAAAKGPVLPLPDILHRYSTFSKNRFILLEDNVSLPDKTYYQIRIQAPEEYEMSCTLKDEKGKNVKGYYMYSKMDKEYTFHFSAPGPGTYTARIYQRDSRGSSNTIALFKIEGQEEGPLLPAEGQLYLFRLFYEKGCFLIPGSFRHDPEKGAYSLTVRCPPGYTMKCYLKDKNEKVVKNGYTTTAEGDLYTFRFTPPDGNYYKGRFYIIDAEKKTKTVGETGVMQGP